MNLLERYLQEIRRHLPATGQDDVIAEISDDLQSQIEAREREHDRALSADEEAAVIKAYGHPRIVASRYREHQYLIGPDLFPFWTYSIRAVLTAFVALDLLGAAIDGTVSGSFAEFLRAISFMWPAILWTFGVVTLIFAAIERVGTPGLLVRIGVTRWNPRTLPPLHALTIPRVQSFFEALINLCVLVWLFDMAGLRRLAEGFLRSRGADFIGPLGLAPSLKVLFEALIVATAAIAVVSVVVFVRPEMAKLRAWTMIAAHAVFAAGACAALFAHSYITARAGTISASALNALNEFVFIGIIAAILISVITISVNIRVLLKKSNYSAYNLAQAAP